MVFTIAQKFSREVSNWTWWVGAKIKQQYGKQLSFWGTIDEQHTLPFGTPEDVSNEIRQRLETVGYDGGLILAPTHHVQLDTPLENFWAMVNTIVLHRIVN